MRLIEFWRSHAGELAGAARPARRSWSASRRSRAVLLGVPIGILAARRPRLGAPIVWLANVAQTIPSLAMFGFLLPLPFIGGLGARVAITVLILYALLPIVRTTVAGMRSVDAVAGRGGHGARHDAGAAVPARRAAAGAAVDRRRHPRRRGDRRRHRDDCGRGRRRRARRVHLPRPVDGRADGDPGRCGPGRAARADVRRRADAARARRFARRSSRAARAPAASRRARSPRSSSWRAAPWRSR